MRPAIYYSCVAPAKAGGEIVNLQHVAFLREMGWRAFALLDDRSPLEAASDALPAPTVRWSRSLVLAFTERDWLVVVEVVLPESLRLLAKLPCRLVMHNQNPFYTYRSFESIRELEAYGFSGALCCSGFTRDRLKRLGSSMEWSVVRPFISQMFAAVRSKKRQIAYMTAKRPAEARMLRNLFCNMYPHHAGCLGLKSRT